MPLVFAALCPHPPLLIPEVGKEQTEKVKDTTKSYELLAKEIEDAEPDTVVIMSPHGLVYPDSFNVNAIKRLKGDFGQFGAPEVSFSYSNNLDLVSDVVKRADEKRIPVVPYDDGSGFFRLDHGALVPLYFLMANLGSNTSVIPMAYSYADSKTHFEFGKFLAEIFAKRPERIAFIASGDMSHRLIENPPASTIGKKFDQDIVNFIKSKDTESIIEYSPESRETAGECAYNSLVTLLGVINRLDYHPDILSYEAPFGVGYLVCNFQLR